MSRITKQLSPVESCGKLGRRALTAPGQHGLCCAVLPQVSERSTSPLRACSACAGDYEDPDRTAAPFDELEEEPDEAAGTVTEGVPVQE